MIKDSWFFIVLLICSCSQKVIYRGDCGGVSGFEQVKRLTHSEKDSWQADKIIGCEGESFSQTMKFDCQSAYIDTPKISKAKLRARKKRLALGFTVDAVPPPAMRNKADEQLARAQKWLDKYERNQANRNINLAAYFLLTTPPAAAAIIALEAAMVGTSQYVFYQILLVLGGVMVLGTWFIGSVIVSFLPEFKEWKAYRKILNSPNKAPEGRQLEYEIRMLLMLNNVMSREEQIRRIQKIREVSQSDLYNPWLSRLKELKYYHESTQKLKRLSVLSDPFTLFLLITLGLPLLVLLGGVISSFF